MLTHSLDTAEQSFSRVAVAASADPSETGSEAKPHELQRVLIADSNPIVRKILRHNFTTLGWEAIEADDGEKVLQLAHSNPAPHAILVDLNLPKINGYDVCRSLKDDIQTQVIPVVAITSLNTAEEKNRALEAGADEFLSKPINQAELAVRLRSLMRIQRFNQELIGAESVAMALARAVASKDGYSNSHVERVANFAETLAESLGLEFSQVKIVRYGAILHNVGKIAIPDAVLEKTGTLTPREKALFQQHPRVGCDICAPLKPLKPVLPIIRHHKEHWDGTGYPDGLRGDEIPLGAQIVGIVDVYAALTSDRPFRAAVTHAVAIKKLRDRTREGCHNPELVERFVQCLEKSTDDPDAATDDQRESETTAI
jgi:putative two-component system response regulator